MRDPLCRSSGEGRERHEHLQDGGRIGDRRWLALSLAGGLLARSLAGAATTGRLWLARSLAGATTTTGDKRWLARSPSSPPA